MLKKLICLLAVLLLCSCNNNAAESSKPKLELLGVAETDTARAMDQKNRQVDNADQTLNKLVDIKSGNKDFTLMIYMVGSNLESRGGAATSDLREIEAVDPDYTKNNVIVYTGGSRRWNSDIPNTSNSILDMSKDREERIVAQTAESADMGATMTLSSFINFCTDNYPAERYGLICWDHGGGPVWGYGADELYDNDSLLLQEMKQALEATIFKEGKKLDFIGFDACLMCSLELAELWKDHASYMVASQELEAGDGWDYSFLSTLKQGDGQAIVKSIVESYGNYYEENQSEFYHPEATLAAIDLSRIDQLSSDLDQFLEALSADYNEESRNELYKILADVKMFGLAASSGEDGYDLLDIADLLEKYSDAYPELSEKIINGVNEAVILQSSNVENTSGLSLYFPGANKQLYEASKELDIYQSEAMKSFNDTYSRSFNTGHKTDWSYADIVYGTDSLDLKLSDDQIKELTTAAYTVLRRNSFGRYAYTLCNISIKPDENNVLHIPADPKVIGAVSDLSESFIPWTFRELDATSDGKNLRTVLSYLSAGADFTDFDRNADEEVQIAIKTFNDSDSIIIRDVVAEQSGAGLSGKGSIDVSHYKTIIDGAFGAYTPSRDENGNMNPFYNWEMAGIEYYPLDLENNFHFVSRNLSDYDGEYVVQVICKDVNGESHASEIYELPRAEKTPLQIKTADGTMYFSFDEDHYEMVGYEGEDEILNIPEQISSYPVTIISNSFTSRNETVKQINVSSSITDIKDEAFYEWKALEKVTLPEGIENIGASAFRRCQKLSEVNFPASLKTMGRGAFAYCDLKEVELGENLVYLGAIPFMGNENLKAISVAASNRQYTDVEGVLFDKDKKILLQYPAAKGESYTIPDGTQEINYGGFAKAELRHVVFPSTLKKIGNNAFFECSFLEELILPDELEEIGERAFGELLLFSLDLDKRSVIEQLHIGPKVNYIGQKAFNGLLIKSFDVDEANETYASAGGFLTNKAKDSIKEVPRAMDELVEIPESITTLNSGIFADAEYVSEFFIKDSTFRYGKDVFPIATYEYDEQGNSIPVYDILIHCSPGSATEEYAMMFELPFDHIEDVEARRKERFTEATEKGQLEFDVYKDHVALVGYKGEDEILEIPDEYHDLKVTEIYKRKRADYSDVVFDGTKVKKIILSDHLEKIDVRIFEDFFYLEDIAFHEQADNYVIENGILMDKNREALIYYFNEGEEVIKLPEGLKRIGSHGFRQSFGTKKVILPKSTEVLEESSMSGLFDLEEVVFNEGLKVIEGNAFGINELMNIALPESLETIGSHTFKMAFDQPDLSISRNLKVIGDDAFYAYEGQYRIKDKIIQIGKDTKVSASSFSGLLFDGFETDKDNQDYSAEGMFLYDKEHKKILSCASVTPETARILDGVEELSAGSFKNAKQLKDIYVPSSLLRIYTTTFEAHYDEGPRYRITVHTPKGSEISRYLKANDIPYVEE